MAKLGHQAKAMYSLCKMVSLARKLKLTKTCEKPLYNQSRVVLCKKGPPPKKLIFQNRQLFKNRQHWPPCKGYSLCKLASLAPKLKFTKTCEKPINNTTRVTLSKKGLQKTANIQKMTPLRKSPKLATKQSL